MRKRLTWTAALAVTLLLNSVTAVHAAIPATINYQGFLTDATTGQPQNAAVSVTFKLYDVLTGGTPLYTETQTVTPSNGTFNAQIGSVTAFPAALAFDKPYWLEIAVGAQTLTPRQPFASSAYAQRAAIADNLSINAVVFPGQIDGSLGGIRDTQIADGAITAGKLSGNGCAAGQVFKYTGTAWGCADVIDPTTPGLTGNFFKQNGNAFGATARIGTSDSQAVEIVANGKRVMRFEQNNSGPNLIGGYEGNSVNASTFGQTVGGGGTAGSYCWNPSTQTYTGPCANKATGAFATVSGGRGNTTTAGFSTVSGGESNTAGYLSTIGGGVGNTASGSGSTIGGGGGGSFITGGNQAQGELATIGGGINNLISAAGTYGTVGGGSGNQAHGPSSTVGGGYGNSASGDHATVPGGAYNAANGLGSFAAGHKAKALNNGCFAWADSNDFDFSCGLDNAFSARATGGFYLVSAINASGGVTAGVQLPPGSGSWASLSDRNSKANVQAVDGLDILDKLAALPIGTWNYQAQDAGIRHIGPMAQDFRAAFGLGEDDKHIATVDADGVALAAIQGLHRKLTITENKLRAAEDQLRAKDRRIDRLERDIAAIKSKLNLP